MLGPDVTTGLVCWLVVPLVSSGAFWCPLIPSGTLWYPLVPSGKEKSRATFEDDPDRVPLETLVRI